MVPSLTLCTGDGVLAQTNMLAANTAGDIPDNMEEKANDADQGPT